MLVCGALLLCYSQVLAQVQSSDAIEQERGRNEASHDVKKGEFVVKKWVGMGSERFGSIPSSDDIYSRCCKVRSMVQNVNEDGK